jgi:hypothetical protein
MQVFTASLAQAGIGVALRSLGASEMLTDVLYRFPDFGWDWSGIGLRMVVGSTCCVMERSADTGMNQSRQYLPLLRSRWHLSM